MKVNTPTLGLGTVILDGRTIVAVVREGEVLDLTAHASSLGLDSSFSSRDVLEQWDELWPQIVDLAMRAVGWVNVEEVEVLAPIEPRQVLQAGANYRTHVIDLHLAHEETAGGKTESAARAEAEQLMDERAATGQPYIFIGLPTAITGPYDDVVLPEGTETTDWELELGAVIGRPAFRVPPTQALDHIAGYTIVNDLTVRELVFRRDLPQIGSDWLRSKNAPGFLPLGPWLVPVDQVDDPMDLRVTLTLNGQVMQDETTKEMIFDVATLVAAASQTARLLPGDLILTGSPAGNGMHWGRMLRDGDVMEGTITGLGTQRTRVVAGA